MRKWRTRGEIKHCRSGRSSYTGMIMIEVVVNNCCASHITSLSLSHNIFILLVCNVLMHFRSQVYWRLRKGSHYGSTQITGLIMGYLTDHTMNHLPDYLKGHITDYLTDHIMKKFTDNIAGYIIGNLTNHIVDHLPDNVQRHKMN